MELRSLPANQWIAEIQWRVVPGLRAQLHHDQTECQKLVAERATINPLAPDPLDATTALFIAKGLAFGQPYQDAFVQTHRSENDPGEHHRAKVQLDSFEKLAQSPEHRAHLQFTVEALLQEDTRLRNAIAENQKKIRVLHDTLQEAGRLIKNLKNLGKANVTMKQSIMGEPGQRLLPAFVTAESPRPTVKRGPKVRI